MSYTIFHAIRDTVFHPDEAFVDKEKALERAKICDTCALKRANVCSRCGCFLPLKVRYVQSSCPEAKW